MSGGIGKDATALVAKLLHRRLARGGIETKRPEIWFHCEPEEPRAWSGGQEVRVRTWRHWSTAQVDYETESGETLRRLLDRYALPETDAELGRERAEAIVESFLEIPGDAVFERHLNYEYAPGVTLCEIRWKRVHKGMRVDGDYLLVRIHPETMRIVEFQRKWRRL